MLRRVVKRAGGIPVFGRLLFMPFRFLVALRYLVPPAKDLILWLVRSREYTNFTYPITPTNRRYLAAFAGHVGGTTYEEALQYMNELEGDVTLRETILAGMERGPHRAFCDRTVHYGRRLGWYAIARAIKPRVVIETGVEKGLGACVLTAALRRNAREGFPGRYFGTDIDPGAGSLLAGDCREYGEILYGDSVDSLRRLDGVIDLFIHDSHHSEAYEAEEYRTIAPKLSSTAVVLSDNSRATEALLDFAIRSGRQFAFFAEFPHRHWYHGGGIGAAFNPRPKHTGKNDPATRSRGQA